VRGTAVGAAARPAKPECGFGTNLLEDRCQPIGTRADLPAHGRPDGERVLRSGSQTAPRRSRRTPRHAVSTEAGTVLAPVRRAD